MQPNNTVNDWAIVIATLLGPLFAVQVQVWLERRRAKQGRRQQVFYALMRTRASTLAPEHVHALNAVPIEFYGVQTITEAYKDYITHLNSAQNETWGLRRVDLYMDLLHKIATELNYKFTVVQLKSEYYAPKWQFDLEAEQATIRQGIANILAGKGALPMEVKAFPVDQEAQEAYKAILKGEKAIKAEVIKP